MPADQPQLLTCKELAFALKKSVSYVYAMRRMGFEMPGKVTTLDEALIWLRAHQFPRGKASHGRKRTKTDENARR